MSNTRWTSPLVCRHRHHIRKQTSVLVLLRQQKSRDRGSCISCASHRKAPPRRLRQKVLLPAMMSFLLQPCTQRQNPSFRARAALLTFNRTSRLSLHQSITCQVNQLILSPVLRVPPLVFGEWLQPRRLLIQTSSRVQQKAEQRAQAKWSSYRHTCS